MELKFSITLLLAFGSGTFAMRCPSPDWYYRKTTDKCYFIQGNEGASGGDSTTGALTSFTLLWDQAVEECRIRGGKIATFSDAEELEWVKTKLVDIDYWTGLTYQNYRWQWYDGETFTEYVTIPMV
ncbi:hypothetical protein BV898_18724 [Hypsibius exemplaris]|uniref:C-type lectin domain-containing protein n=1 Tax=Hypsibius exemplaris TaxID=2072580 RepID=A0A9X6NK61_HYPEX|nr:hypothetical protein BV898_18724 [Hypsibius exemplaris]